MPRRASRVLSLLTVLCTACARDTATGVPLSRATSAASHSMTFVRAGFDPTVSEDRGVRCVIGPDSLLRCTGSDVFGPVVPPSDLGAVRQVSVGPQHKCAVRTSGLPVCWGPWGEGVAPPPDLTDVIQIAAHREGSCAIDATRRVRCWGPWSPIGAPRTPVTAARQIDAGDEHACAVLENTTVRCWGYFGEGETSPPADLIGVVQVLAGREWSCALTNTGRVVCWGLRAIFGIPSVLDGVVQLRRTDDLNACAVRTDGTHKCWPRPDGEPVQDLYGTPTVNFTPPATAKVGDLLPLSAIGGGSSEPVVFVSRTPLVCDIKNNAVLRLIAAGTCHFDWSQAGDRNYRPVFAGDGISFSIGGR